MNRPYALLCASFLMVLSSGCTQSGGGVAVHRYGDATSSKSFGVHTIQSGETLWAISQAYHVELRDMLDLNRFNPPYNVRSGTRIRIPAPRTYDVQKGDTLYRVSRMFDTTTTDLARLNSLKSPYVLAQGQSLRLPEVRRNSGSRSSGAVAKSSVKNSPAVSQAVVARVGSVQSEKLEPAASPKQEVTVAKNISPRSVTGQRGQGFLTPVSGRVVSSFGAKKDGLHNDGINIKAARGTAVRAAENGNVVYVGNEIEGYGDLILIRHADGYVTAYAHLEKTLTKKGDVVTRGQTIGTVGSSGHVESPQLHFEIRRGKKAINPVTLIKV